MARGASEGGILELYCCRHIIDQRLDFLLHFLFNQTREPNCIRPTRTLPKSDLWSFMYLINDKSRNEAIRDRTLPRISERTDTSSRDRKQNDNHYLHTVCTSSARRSMDHLQIAAVLRHHIRPHFQYNELIDAGWKLTAIVLFQQKLLSSLDCTLPVFGLPCSSCAMGVF